jgi:hypothetical protein
MKRSRAIQSLANRAVPRINVMTHTRTRPLTGGDDTKEVT